jgi:STE24 endopeptidase
MIRLIAIGLALLASAILLLVLREERLVAQGKVPLGRLRRFWFKEERRRAPRYRIDWEVRYLRLEPAAGPALSKPFVLRQAQDERRGEGSARTRDVSQTGVGLVVRERLEVGSPLQLELIPPIKSTPLLVLGEVAWIREMEPTGDNERLFFAGVRFHPMEDANAARLRGFMEGGLGLDPHAKKARDYSSWKRRLWLADLILTTSLLVILLGTGWARSLEIWIAGRISLWPVQVAAYVGLLGIGMAVVSFPFDWFSSFTLEHRFGLATQRFGQWLCDTLKRLGVGGILGLLAVEGLVALIRWDPRNWWGWAAFVWVGWSMLLTRLAPILLIPIFYRQQPLKDTALRQRLEQLLKRCQVRFREIFEVNLSRTTRKANACLCGLGPTRRVLVSDTLLGTHTAEEIEVVLAHEVGHHRLHHLGLLIAIGAVGTGLGCFIVNQLVQNWLNPLDLRGLSDLAALPLIGLCFLGVGLVGMPVTNGISRWLERQADRFALKLTGHPEAFISTMRRLAEQNLAEIDPPRWAEWLLYDHPPIAKRIALAETYLKDSKNV